MELKYSQEIAKTLGFSLKQIDSIAQLQSEGATIPFMARYRKEATDNMDEVEIGRCGRTDQIILLNWINERKRLLKPLKVWETNARIKDRIENCYDATELEDIYLPYKPKRKTRATQAIEKGLEPLAKLLFEQGSENPDEEAAKYINEQVKDMQRSHCRAPAISLQNG